MTFSGTCPKGYPGLSNWRAPVTALHAGDPRIPVWNPTPMPLEIIEVQSGAYLGEDDIVPYTDDYGRVAPTPPT